MHLLSIDYLIAVRANPWFEPPLQEAIKMTDAE
jgi:hypothetical protein